MLQGWPLSAAAPVALVAVAYPAGFTEQGVSGGELYLFSTSLLNDRACSLLRLPTDRFTVVCNCNVKGFIKTATIRFGAAGAFTPLGKTTPVGTLTDCVIPR